MSISIEIFILASSVILSLILGLWWGYKQGQQKTRDIFQKQEQILLIDNRELQTRLEILQEQTHMLKNQEEKIKDAVSQRFELLAQKIFEEKTHRFQDLSIQNLNLVLNPLKEKLKDFEKKVEETYASERSERGHLRGEINKLLELNQVMSTEARNLTMALKGDNKSQGNWGEMILENILERSGLREGHEFTVQGQDLDLKNDSGQRMMPDVIVHLPGNKHLIVDAKMTLKAFEAYSSSPTDAQRESAAKMHLKSLEDHIQGLSNKKYHLSSQLITPDFVMLFMPLEPAFALAFQLKPELFNMAWEKNIAIVSPTTLLTTLRTVANLWKQEKQQKNAMEIARRGGLLYEKFANLLGDFKTLGDRIDSVQKTHGEISKKLSEGRGNLISQVEELKELGVKTEKNLPSLEGSKG